MDKTSSSTKQKHQSDHRNRISWMKTGLTFSSVLAMIGGWVVIANSDTTANAPVAATSGQASSRQPVESNRRQPETSAVQPSRQNAPVLAPTQTPAPVAQATAAKPTAQPATQASAAVQAAATARPTTAPAVAPTATPRAAVQPTPQVQTAPRTQRQQPTTSTRTRSSR